VKILLDENVPIQTLDLLSRVLRGHEVDHVDRIRWKGKKDSFLLPDAASAGYDVLVTKDSNQLEDPAECRLIRRSKIHHVRFRQGEGIRGLGAAVASVIVAMPQVVTELEAADGQRLVRIEGINPVKRRHTTIDPKVNPPAYW
jgi:predicted nuclease of predicted toxin-antitoxin system